MGNHRSAVNSANGSRQGRNAFWTAARVEMLRNLWDANQYASEIALALGDGCTKAMVIGKAHRLKLVSCAHRQNPGRLRRVTPIRVPCETSEAA